MEKELKIEIPKGYEIDKEKSTFEKIVFKESKGLPKTWEELKTVDGWYIANNSGGIHKYAGTHINKNLIPTLELAKAMLALCQLLQLRDRYNDGWEPDWKNNEQKHCIVNASNNISIDYFYGRNAILSFKTEELRDEFYNNFRDLIETAKLLL